MCDRIPATLLVGLSVFIIGCGGSSTLAPNPPNDNAAAVEFLKLIRDGKTAEAWQFTGTEFKSFLGQADFTKYVKQHPVLKANIDDGVLSTDTVNSVSMASWTFRAKDEKKSTIKVQMNYEGNVWRVAGVKVE